MYFQGLLIQHTRSTQLTDTWPISSGLELMDKSTGFAPDMRYLSFLLSDLYNIFYQDTDVRYGQHYTNCISHTESK